MVKTVIRASGPLLLLCCATSTLNGQLNAFDKQYRDIRAALPSLKRDSVELWGYSTDGGTATRYRDSSGAVLLVEVQLYGESGKARWEYYFHGGDLFLVSVKRSQYNVPYYVNDSLAKEIEAEPFDPAKTQLLEDRYYFTGSRLLRWIDERGRRVDADSPKAAEAAAQLLRLAKDALATFK